MHNFSKYKIYYCGPILNYYKKLLKYLEITCKLLVALHYYKFIHWEKTSVYRVHNGLFLVNILLLMEVVIEIAT